MKQNLTKQLGLFIGITFGLTYLLDVLGYLKLGLISPETITQWQPYLSVQMFIPAVASFVVMKLHKHQFPKPTQYFWGIFLAIALLSGLSLVYDPVLFIVPQNGSEIPITLSVIGIQLLSVIGSVTILILLLRKSTREQLTSTYLSLGVNKRYYLISLLLLSIWIFINAYFNSIFNLGDPSVLFNPLLFLVTFAGVLIVAPFTNWAFFFGEEYGWRVFLQERLISLLGTLKGILAVGIIWGLWHAPVIAMGYNYPGQPVLGVILMTLFTVLIGMIYSITVIKTNSVWSAVWLHLATNNGISLSMAYISQPNDPVNAFGIGVYGLILLTIFSLGFALSSRVFEKYYAD